MITPLGQGEHRAVIPHPTGPRGFYRVAGTGPSGDVVVEFVTTAFHFCEGETVSPTITFSAPFTGTLRYTISGDTLVVGAMLEETGGQKYAGAAYVFERNGNQWDRQRLVPSIVVERDYFGQAVDIDGDTIIVGAPHDPLPWSAYPGRAFIFERDPITREWSQHEHAKLTANPVVSGGYFGAGLSLHDKRLDASAVSPRAYYSFLQVGDAVWQQVYANIDPHHPRYHSISVAFRTRSTRGCSPRALPAVLSSIWKFPFIATCWNCARRRCGVISRS